MPKLPVLFLPLLLLVPAASSESAPIFYDFTLAFNAGDLAGQNFVGSFSVDGNDCLGGVCDGIFRPPLDATTLLSFDMTVDGVTFGIEDDAFFPNLPRVDLDAGNVSLIDFLAEGSPAFLQISFSEFFNLVSFGPENTRTSLGTITDIELQEAVPEPATLTLFGLGGVSIARRWRQRRT